MRSNRSSAAALSRTRAHPAWLPALAGVVLAAHLWRTRYGVDLGDGSHAVALAVRLARGDQPFVDEMNAQVLGAWPAVPLTWAWLNAVGLDGIVLASRVGYVLVAAACAYVAWRALAPHLGRAVAAGAVAVATVPTAYNLQVVSYNSTPALLLLVAVSAAVAARARSSRGWAVASGACAALAGVSHPAVIPAAAVLLLLVLVIGPARVRPWALAGALAVAGVVGALVLAVWGTEAVAATLSYTRAYQAFRAPLPDRLASGAEWFAAELAGVAFVAAAALGAAAASSRLGRARVAALVGVVVLATVRAVGRGVDGRTVWTWSWTSAVHGLVLLVLLVPAALSAATSRPRGPLPDLLVTGLATTLAGVPVVVALTSSAPVWGAFAAVLPPGLLAVSAGALTVARSHGRPAAALVAAALVGSLGLVHAGTTFRQASAWALEDRVTHGAFAGLVTGTAMARPTDPEPVVDVIDHAAAAIAACGARGDGLLTYAFPSGYLLADRRFDTPMVWLAGFGPANAAGVDWIEHGHRVPECVAVARPVWEREATLARRDPLLRWVDERYVPVATSGSVVVLAPAPPRRPRPRDGAVDTAAGRGTPVPAHGHLG